MTRLSVIIARARLHWGNFKIVKITITPLLCPKKKNDIFSPCFVVLLI